MALSMAFTVVILNIHHRGSHKRLVSSWIRTLVLDWIATIVMLKHIVRRHDTAKTKVCESASNEEYNTSYSNKDDSDQNNHTILIAA